MGVLEQLIFAFEVVKYTWPFILLIGMFIMKKRMDKYPIEAKIIEKRGENLITTNDRIGKYVDKHTGMVGYKFQKTGDTVPVLNYEYVVHNIYNPTNAFEWLISRVRKELGCVFFFKYGTKQYKPVEIRTKEGLQKTWEEIKDDKGNTLSHINIYEQFDPRDKLGALDFDVVDWDNMNFMVQEQRASFDRRRSHSDLIKGIIVPIAALAVTALVCILMLKYSLDKSTELSSVVCGGQEQNINIKDTSNPVEETPFGKYLPGQ